MDWASVSIIVGIVTGIIGAIATIIQLIQNRKIDPAIPVKTSQAKQKKVFQNLPPRGEFVGRSNDKAQIHKALRAQARIVSIDGIGGIGKSSLALEVAYECLHASEHKPWFSKANSFRGIVWTSAKGRELTLNSLLDTIALTFGDTGIVQQPLETKQTSITELLGDTSCLLIVDNFETIKDTALREYLTQLPAQTKVMITSREKVWSSATPITIGDLPFDEFLELVRVEGRRLGLAAFASAGADVATPLYKATGGAPLAIKWAIGQIKQKGQSLDSVLSALEKARGDIFEQIFARSWGELLTENARSVLKTIPLFAASVSYAALEAVCNIHSPDLDDALGQLVEMSLVEATDEIKLSEKRYSIHPLTRAFSLKALESSPGEMQAAIARLGEYYRKFGYEYRKLWPFEKIDFSALPPEIPNIYQAIEFLDKDSYKTSFEILRQVATFLFMYGFWNDLLVLASRIADFAKDAQDEVTWARLQTWPISSIHRHRGDFDLALNCVEQSLEILSRYQEEKYQAMTWRHQGRIQQERRHYEEAEIALTKAYEYYQRSNETWDIMVLRVNLAELALERERLDEAMEWSEKALELLPNFYDKETRANINIAIGRVFLKRGNIIQARQHLQIALDDMQGLNRPDSIADSSYWLAQVEILSGNKKKARVMLEQALKIYKQMGIHTKIIQTEQELAGL